MTLFSYTPCDQHWDRGDCSAEGDRKKDSPVSHFPAQMAKADPHRTVLRFPHTTGHREQEARQIRKTDGEPEDRTYSLHDDCWSAGRDGPGGQWAGEYLIADRADVVDEDGTLPQIFALGATGCKGVFVEARKAPRCTTPLDEQRPYYHRPSSPGHPGLDRDLVRRSQRQHLPSNGKSLLQARLTSSRLQRPQ
jgi:hypothetical protein